MDKKIIIGIIVVILIIAGAIGYYTLNSGNKFGSSSIDIPKGFEVEKNYKHGLSITNNNTNYFIKEFSNSSVDKQVKTQFSEYKENDTVVNGSLTVANTPVKSMTLKNDKNKTTHTYYFYEKNNKTFVLFAKGTDNSTAVNEIISTTA